MTFFQNNFENCGFESADLDFLFQKKLFFVFIPMKFGQIFLGIKDGSKF